MRAAWLALVALGSACGGGLPPYHCVEAVQEPVTVAEIASIAGIAYVAASDRVAVYDVSDPTKPKALSSLPVTGGAVVALATGGGRLVVARDSQISVYDASAPAAPTLLGTLTNTISTVGARSMVTDGHWVYAGRPNGGVVVYDISSGTPVMATVIGEGGANVILHGRTLYSTRGSLFVADVSDPAHPLPAAPVEREGLKLETLNIHGDVLYGYTPVLGTGGSDSWGPVAIDVSAPLAPKLSDEVIRLRVAGRIGQTDWFHDSLLSVQGGVVHATHVGSGTSPNGASGDITSDIDIGAGQSTSCTIEPNSLQNVHAVGESIVATGNTSTVFFAPQ